MHPIREKQYVVKHCTNSNRPELLTGTLTIQTVQQIVATPFMRLPKQPFKLFKHMTLAIGRPRSCHFLEKLEVYRNSTPSREICIKYP